MTRTSKPSVAKIGLLSTLDCNIGDDFIRTGIIAVIASIHGEKNLRFQVINKHQPESMFTFQQNVFRKMLHRLNRSRLRNTFIPGLIQLAPMSRFDKFDLLIQCGTPTLWNGCRNSEWADPIWKDVFHRLSLQGKPVLNLGAGTCYGIETLPSTLLGDDDEAFARLMIETCQLTTVRDQLARKLFSSIGCDVEVVCCPALLTGMTFTSPVSPTKKVVVNFMEGGGHFDWGQKIDAHAWRESFNSMVAKLKQDGWDVVFIAHDSKEANTAKKYWPNFRCINSATMKEYFEVIRDAAFGVFNRMHASVAAAGLGIPSIAIGTDSRNFMVSQVGLPAAFVKDASTERLMDAIFELARNRDSHSCKLLDIRKKTFDRYTELLSPILSTLN